jgi:hypothetical protein
LLEVLGGILRHNLTRRLAASRHTMIASSARTTSHQAYCAPTLQP